MQFYGYHGLFPEERKLGQRFNVDVVLHTDVRQAARTDEMENSIDYGHAYEIIHQLVEGEAKNLLETVAESIAKNLLDTFHSLQACDVKVTKPNPPIHGHYQSVAVEIYRERS